MSTLPPKIILTICTIAIYCYLFIKPNIKFIILIVRHIKKKAASSEKLAATNLYLDSLNSRCLP